MSKERAAQLVEAGIWLKLSGDVSGARRLFERALKLDPDSERARELLERPGSDVVPPVSSPSPNPFERPSSPSGVESDWGSTTAPVEMQDWGSLTGQAASPVPAVPPVTAPSGLLFPSPVPGEVTAQVDVGETTMPVELGPVRAGPPVPDEVPEAPEYRGAGSEVPRTTQVFGGSSPSREGQASPVSGTSGAGEKPGRAPGAERPSSPGRSTMFFGGDPSGGPGRDSPVPRGGGSPSSPGKAPGFAEPRGVPGGPSSPGRSTMSFGGDPSPVPGGGTPASTGGGSPSSPGRATMFFGGDPSPVPGGGTPAPAGGGSPSSPGRATMFFGGGPSPVPGGGPPAPAGGGSPSSPGRSTMFFGGDPSSEPGDGLPAPTGDGSPSSPGRSTLFFGGDPSSVAGGGPPAPTGGGSPSSPSRSTMFFGGDPSAAPGSSPSSPGRSTMPFDGDPSTAPGSTSPPAAGGSPSSPGRSTMFFGGDASSVPGSTPKRSTAGGPGGGSPPGRHTTVIASDPSGAEGGRPARTTSVFGGDPFGADLGSGAPGGDAREYGTAPSGITDPLSTPSSPGRSTQVYGGDVPPAPAHDPGGPRATIQFGAPAGPMESADVPWNEEPTVPTVVPDLPLRAPASRGSGTLVFSQSTAGPLPPSNAEPVSPMVIHIAEGDEGPEPESIVDVLREQVEAEKRQRSRGQATRAPPDQVRTVRAEVRSPAPDPVMTVRAEVRSPTPDPVMTVRAEVRSPTPVPVLGPPAAAAAPPDPGVPEWNEGPTRAVEPARRMPAGAPVDPRAAWDWNPSAAVPSEAPQPRPSPGLAAQALSAWDQRSNPGIHLRNLVGPDQMLELVSTGSRITPNPPVHREEVATLLRGAKDLIDLDDHTGAMELIGKAQSMAPDDPEVSALRERSERTLLAMFESKLGTLERVPRVLLKDDEIIWLNLDHRAGFVLAQIDGTVSFDDVFAVSGMSRLDTARILAQLVDEGVISRG